MEFSIVRIVADAIPLTSHNPVTTIASITLIYPWSTAMRRYYISRMLERLSRDRRGGVFVEYLLLLTIVGIGVIAGLAAVRGALINELVDLANAIAAIA